MEPNKHPTFSTEFRFGIAGPDSNAPETGPGPGLIYGPIYYIGTRTVCSYLVKTSSGLVIIDTGFEEDFEIIANNIRSLGFSPEDIHWILNTHWHEDHTGGNTGFARISGAQVMIHELDTDIVESGLFKGKDAVPRCRVSRRLKHGDTIPCGEFVFDVIHCPGQSPGSVVFMLKIPTTQGNCRAIFAGDASGFKCNLSLYDRYGYPEAAGHYRDTVSTLKSLEFDLYLGGHPHQVVSEMRSDGNPFVTHSEWLSLLESRHNRMEEFVNRKLLISA